MTLSYYFSELFYTRTDFDRLFDEAFATRIGGGVSKSKHKMDMVVRQPPGSFALSKCSFLIRFKARTNVADLSPLTELMSTKMHRTIQ
jgi:hypothetical protein